MDVSGYAPLVASVVVLAGVLLTLRQKARTDRKNQWWKRTQWAIDLTLDERNEARTLGYAMLEQQAASRLADREDLALLSAALAPDLWTLDRTIDEGDDASVDDEEGP